MIDYRLAPPLSDAQLNDLFGSAWPAHAPRPFGQVLARNLTHVAAFEGPQLVGFVNVGWDGGAHAFLLDPTVRASHQRRGIGRALVARALDAVRNAGVEWLHVDYEPALESFYTACGFRSTLAGLIHLNPAESPPRPLRQFETPSLPCETPRPVGAQLGNSTLIRMTTQDDVQALSLLQRSWAAEGTTHGFVPANEEQIRAALGPCCLVAVEHGRVVGFVTAVRREGEATAVMPASPYLEIEDLYVVPELRGHGIGKALIDRLLAQAKAQGIQHASVYSAAKDLRRVMRFYEQAGFESWYVRMFRKL